MRPWELPEFGTGLTAGVVGLAVVLGLAALARRAGWPSALPAGGLAFAVAGLWSVHGTRPAPAAVIAGVAGMALVAGLGHIRWVPMWAMALLASPFGWLIAVHGGIPEVAWVRILVATTVVVGGLLAAATDHQWRGSAPGPILLVLTVGGVYATVPDTEEAVALLGVVVPLGILGWPVSVLRLGRSGAGAAVAVIVWVTAIGGAARPASIVGGLACLGLLGTLPVAEIVADRAHLRRTASAAPVVVAGVVAAHALVVGIASRAAGLRTDVATAVFIAVAALMAAVVVSALIGTVERSPDAPPAGHPEPPSELITRWQRRTGK